MYVCLYAIAACPYNRPVIAERVQRDDLQLAALRRDQVDASSMFVDTERMLTLFFFLFLFFHFLKNLSKLENASSNYSFLISLSCSIFSVSLVASL